MNKINHLFAAVAFLVAFALYLYTSLPVIGWGDGADFVLTSHFLGVPHPTGYPLFILLGKIVSFIPIGDVAFRIALLSSLCSAASVAVLFLLVEKWSGNTSAALYAAAVMMFSTFLWGNSIMVEAYALNIFLFLVLALVFLHTGDIRSVLFFFFISALALGNHGTIVFPMVVFGLFALAVVWRSGQLGRLLLTAGFVAFAAITLYAALPLLSARTNIFDWNQPENIKALTNLISGHDFWVLGEYKTMEMRENVINLLKSISHQTTPLALIPLFFAMFYLLKKSLSKTLALSVVMIFCLAFTIVYPTKEKESFSMVSFVILVFFCGAGLGIMLNLTKRWKPLRIFSAGAVFILLIGHIYSLVAANGKYLEYRLDAGGGEYSDLIFNSAPRDALIFIDHIADDAIIPPLYFQFTGNQRRDTFIFHRLYLAFPWYLDAMRDRADEIGVSVKIPQINIDKERYRIYKITLEEFRRFEETGIINIVDIQTRKLIDENLPYRTVLINTPSRFRLSLTSAGLNFIPYGGLFLVTTTVGAHGRAPLLRTPNSELRTTNNVFRSILHEYFCEKAFIEISRKDYQAALKSMKDAVKYKETKASHALLMQLYFLMGNDAKGKQELKKYLDRIKAEHGIN
ncbi:MAG: DUF2723 domain-containing protein [bacterium]